jgi:hypothetical protein
VGRRAAAEEAASNEAEVARIVGKVKRVDVYAIKKFAGGLPVQYVLKVQGKKGDVYAIVDIESSAEGVLGVYRCLFDRNPHDILGPVSDYCAESVNAKSDKVKAALQQG